MIERNRRLATLNLPFTRLQVELKRGNFILNEAWASDSS